MVFACGPPRPLTHDTLVEDPRELVVVLFHHLLGHFVLAELLPVELRRCGGHAVVCVQRCCFATVRSGPLVVAETTPLHLSFTTRERCEPDPGGTVGRSLPIETGT